MGRFSEREVRRMIREALGDDGSPVFTLDEADEVVASFYDSISDTFGTEAFPEFGHELQRPGPGQQGPDWFRSGVSKTIETLLRKHGHIEGQTYKATDVRSPDSRKDYSRATGRGEAEHLRPMMKSKDIPGSQSQIDTIGLTLYSGVIPEVEAKHDVRFSDEFRKEFAEVLGPQILHYLRKDDQTVR